MAQEAQAQAFLQQARVSPAGPLPTFMGEGQLEEFRRAK